MDFWRESALGRRKGGHELDAERTRHAGRETKTMSHTAAHR